MLEDFLRVAAEVGPEAALIVACFAMAVIAAFVVYVGIMLFVTLRAPDDQQRIVRHEMFRELLDLFRRGNRR